MNYLAVTLIDQYEEALQGYYDQRDKIEENILKIKKGRTTIRLNSEKNEELSCLFLQKNIIQNKIAKIEYTINDLQIQTT